MTYSILAWDEETRALGVAVQSHHVCAGAHVVGAERGVGLVAVQSYADRTYAERALELLRAGDDPEGTLAVLIDGGLRPHRAQLAVADTSGNLAAHTGDACVEHAGHRVAGDVVVQANMARSPRVWPAMHTAFQSAAGDLAERLLAALDAAEAAGGDWRGRQSAALTVLPGTDAVPPEVIDLRVDDDPRPLVELRRLDRLRRAARRMSEAFTYAEDGNVDRAVDELDAAQDVYGPGNPEPTAWSAVLLARAGRTTEARQRLRRASSVEPGWVGFVEQLPAVGLLPDAPDLVDELLESEQR